VEPDYGRLGLRCGLEIHRQLDTSKLFCACPSGMSEDVTGQITRRLRPSKSEMGLVDEAAAQEGALKREFTYQLTRFNCLVEMDEEPPHDLNPEALSIALTISRLLKAEPVDEVQVMRKIVIDGSNTTGFQRTALLALYGRLDTPFGPVGIDTICLEEDAARIIEQGFDRATYRLDRLCIPEIEIATSPDVHTPQQAMEAARAIGDALRASGRVRRGIGTIRQDVNVSIAGGARVELKLVQELQSIPEVVRQECLRQVRLVEVKEELAKRGVTKEGLLSGSKVQDITQLFSDTGSKVLSSMLKKGGCVLGVRLAGFAHLMGSRLEALPKEQRVATPANDYNSKRILGPEFAQYAKVHGVKGIFHSDELPAYGVTEAEVAKVSGALGCSGNDAFVLVAEAREIAQRAMDAVIQRAAMSFGGVPGEVRRPLADGTSEYMRPLPGASRMYPETDVRPIRLTQRMMADIDAHLPETFEAKQARYVSQYGLSKEAANQIVFAADFDMFEKAVSGGAEPKVMATMLLNTFSDLKAKGLDTGLVTPEALGALFTVQAAKGVPRDALGALLEFYLKEQASASGAKASDQKAVSGSRVAPGPKTATDLKAVFERAVASLGIGGASDDEMLAVIRKLCAERQDFIKQKGPEAAKGPLMGPVMKELKGKADGKRIGALLEKVLREYAG